MTHTLIFDIGKTNKKCFLFDENYQEVWKEYVRFDEIKDEDGHLCDNIALIENWMITTFKKVISLDQYNVKAVNFSTYGASFVHINDKGEPVAPLYNYLKPLPEDILNQFYAKYGSEMALAKETASPPLQMLNSGMQLYYLKYAKPEIFNKIRWSLHLPQYLGKKLKMGFGIHDSSAALIPYLKAQKKPFLLISTGTWSISINPFNNNKLRTADLKNDCLNFLRPSGESVKAARLFLGNEYKVQVEKLRSHYTKEEGYHRTMKFDEQLFFKLKKSSKNYFRLESISKNSNKLSKTNLSKFATYEEAYHQLMIELMELQIQTIDLAIGKSSIEKIFIDGGFADNDSFVKIIAHYFNKYKIRTTQSPLGSALGAAMIVSDKKVKKNFLKKHYAMKKQLTWK